MPGKNDPLIAEPTLYEAVGSGEAARLLGVTSQSVRDFVKAGKLLEILTLDGKHLHPIDSVRRLAEERRNK